MSDTPISVDDYERLARAKMDRAAFDHYAGGSGQERTLAANRSAFDAIQFRPRVLVDVSRVDLATTGSDSPSAYPSCSRRPPSTAWHATRERSQQHGRRAQLERS